MVLRPLAEKARELVREGQEKTLRTEEVVKGLGDRSEEDFRNARESSFSPSHGREGHHRAHEKAKKKGISLKGGKLEYIIGPATVIIYVKFMN